MVLLVAVLALVAWVFAAAWLHERERNDRLEERVKRAECRAAARDIGEPTPYPPLAALHGWDGGKADGR